MEQSALTGMVRKPSMCLGLSSAVPTLWLSMLNGQECFPAEPCPRSFAPARLSAVAIVATWRCPLGVLGWVRVGGCFPTVMAKALPAHAGDTTSLPVIACPGICGYILRAV